MERRPAIGALIAAFAAVPLLCAAPEDCHKLKRRGQREPARACYEKLSASRSAYERAEGYWGLGLFSDANTEFKQAVNAEPKNPLYRVRWGRLFLERFNKSDAIQLFQEALDIDKSYAPALLGMALAASESFESKAVELAEEALKNDPKLVEAQELLANLALEDSDPKKAVAEADKALAISPDALDALAVKAAVEALADRPHEPVLAQVWKVNPSYGQAHAIVAHHLVLNRRYEEGIAHYRKAIALDPSNWAARSELGINLMRIGEDKEAREQLEAAYENNYRNNPTVNSLRLLDSYRNFVTFKTEKTILRLHKKEAALLRLYIEPELRRAVDTFEKKYKMTIGAPVQLEVYPDHEDFAVRTMGMPGLGALGVTFGRVVAMDSPSGRRPGSFHWASTLWHELSHVFVLTATKHRVPRWFTEGLAVHEETAASPDWGDRMTPDIIEAIRGKKLLPVAELDRGFIRPKYPSQVVVSYFQGGRICDYIEKKWGYAKLLEMMHLFGERKTTPEVIRAALGMEPEAFDREFLAWVEAEAGPAVSKLDEWRKTMLAIATARRAKDNGAVIEKGNAAIAMYPEFVEGGSAYEEVADAYESKGDKTSARKTLEAYSKLGGKNPATLKKLARWQEEMGDKAAAAATLERINFVYPVKDEELHRKLGELSLALSRPRIAVREFEAVVAGQPLDAASAHYNLARAYQQSGQTAKAEEQVLLALEAAPGYRPAQKMLLELDAAKTKEKP
jgi:tetratricopeptide (TPR) repeat protein